MLLLDTHTLLWWLGGDDQLSETARGAIQSATGPVYVSAASIWEISIKRSLGKLTIPTAWYEATLTDFAELKISADHARRAGQLPPHHRDPFDRMLVAQAAAQGLTLVSGDPAFDAYGVDVLW